jgi:uncharacterized protein YbjT (DUF2867 family)
MTILVTGSTGTIGSQVLTHLQGRVADVRALTRSPGLRQSALLRWILYVRAAFFGAFLLKFSASPSRSRF